jgi:hypothetical protein
MKKISFKFAGKEWTVDANNSGWVAPGAPTELVELLKNAPRSGYTSKGCPIVKSDDGTNIYLGAAELHQGKNEVVGSSGSSSGPSLAMPEAVLLDFLKLSDQLSEVSLAFLKSEKEKLDKQKELEKAKKEQSLKNLNPNLDLGNLSEEQLKALETLGFKF